MANRAVRRESSRCGVVMNAESAKVMIMADISYETLLESLFDGVYFVDLNRKILIWNNGAERITGYSKEEVMGSCCSQSILRHVNDAGEELCLAGCPIAQTMLDGSVHSSSIFLHHKMGHRVPVSVRTSPVRDAAGTIIGAIEIFTDNSNALQILKELEDMKKEAYLDALTAVGNRRYGEVVLNTRIYEWVTHGIPFGVIFLDIDFFKNFNDTYGHKTGDDVLVMVGKSIFNTLRRVDTVTRWGGEEFVIFLPNVSRTVLKQVADRVCILIERSFMIVDGVSVNVTASLGATLTVAGDTAESIVWRADKLMYASKKAGRNRVTLD